MKLATLKTSRPDGELVIVSRDLRTMMRVNDIAPTLQAALDDWITIRPRLDERYQALLAGKESKKEHFDPTKTHSPLPRAYQWLDGSVYAAHDARMSKWINKPPSEAFLKEPWMYQGASDGFIAPTGDIPAITEDWGIDYEAEVAIITDAVPYATRTKDAGRHICLVMLCNDVSLRNLIPAELAKGFGFVQSKPASAFSPVAVTPDELGDAWHDYRLALPLLSYLNEELYGMPNAGEMAHGFDRLVAHAAKTRSLSAGTIIGGGTVANENPAKGTSCLVERRVLEILEHGAPKTPFLKFGDKVCIEMLDREGHSIFGAIEQRVTKVSV